MALRVIFDACQVLTAKCSQSLNCGILTTREWPLNRSTLQRTTSLSVIGWVLHPSTAFYPDLSLLSMIYTQALTEDFLGPSLTYSLQFITLQSIFEMMYLVYACSSRKMITAVLSLLLMYVCMHEVHSASQRLDLSGLLTECTNIQPRFPPPK